MKTKKCSKCKVESPIDNFYKNSKLSDGLNSQCKNCYRRYNIDWVKRNPEYHKSRLLKYLYNITIEDYNILSESQKGVCAICSRPETEKLKGTTKVLSVDHCHETGRIRGLLCTACNTILGRSKDDRLILLSAIEYLDRNSNERSN